MKNRSLNGTQKKIRKKYNRNLNCHQNSVTHRLLLLFFVNNNKNINNMMRCIKWPPTGFRNKEHASSKIKHS